MYVSEKCGNDETGNGTEQKPFKTLLHVSIIKMLLSLPHRVKGYFLTELGFTPK